MASYFENLVNNVGNPFNLDIVVAARNMLIEALDYQKKSLKLFELSKKDDVNDDWWWQQCCEADKCAEGLLIAYKTLTIREVMNHQFAIKDEIQWIEETFNI